VDAPLGRGGRGRNATGPIPTDSGVKLGRVWTTISGKWILRVFCVLGRVPEVNLEHLNSGFPRSFWVI